jgi:hypothetical protein
MAIQKAQRGHGERVWSLKTSMSNGRMDRGLSRHEWYGPAPGRIPVKPRYQELARRLGIEGTVLPNAKSVSERIWKMSHHVRSNPAHRSHAFVSPSLTCQEAVRLSQGYNACQTSHCVRPNTLATPLDLIQYPFMRPNPVSVRATSYAKPSALDKVQSACRLQEVCWTLDPTTTPIEHVRVDHRRTDVFMPE